MLTKSAWWQETQMISDVSCARCHCNKIADNVRSFTWCLFYRFNVSRRLPHVTGFTELALAQRAHNLTPSPLTQLLLMSKHVRLASIRCVLQLHLFSLYYLQCQLDATTRNRFCFSIWTKQCVWSKSEWSLVFCSAQWTWRSEFRATRPV